YGGAIPEVYVTVQSLAETIVAPLMAQQFAPATQFIPATEFVLVAAVASVSTHMHDSLP
ncbi:hypothetical protein Dimus_001674, partial [Dionaea muscipula]